MPTITKRQRATAIILFEDGILLTGMRYMAYMLPGGGIAFGEQPHYAVMREVYEETRLETHHVQFLFEFPSYTRITSSTLFRRAARQSLVKRFSLLTTTHPRNQ